MGSSRHGSRRAVRVALIVVLALALAGFAGFRLASRAGLNRELADARAKGLPTNPKELNEWYAAVPDAENSAVTLLQAGSVFVEAPKDSDPGEIDWRELPHSAALDAKTLSRLQAYLDRNAEALRLMREAARMQRSRYPTDLSKAPDIKFDYLIPLKRLSQLARYSAVYHAERGEAAAALDALRSGFAAAHTLAQEPLVIAELVRIACVSIQVFGLERIVHTAHFDEAQLTELAGLVRSASGDCTSSLQRALCGERAFANTGRKLSFDEYEQAISMGGLAPITSEVPEPLRKLLFYGRRAIGMHDRDQAFYLRSLGRMIDAAGLEHPRLFAASEALAAEIVNELNEHPIAYELASFSIGSMLRIPNKEVILTARLRCIETALRLEQWRRKHDGQLPREDALPALLEDYPRDPVDGAPLRFRPDGRCGYRVIASAATAEEKKGGVNAKSPGIGFSVEK